MINRISMSFLVIAVLFARVAFASGEVIPVVPVSVMKNNVPPPIKPKESANRVQRNTTSNISDVNTDSVLTMSIGVNQIIPIAVGHPNRIVTPFEKPEVISTSLSGESEYGKCGEVCIKDNVVYVATDRKYPVTMFITEHGNQDQALSLTMVPRKIPPREVFLKLDTLDGSHTGFGFGSKKAESWEKSQPYVETIRTVFRTIALGEIPSGYSLNPIRPELTPPRCSMKSVTVDFSRGQFLSGHNINVFIGVARNTTSKTVEIKEPECGGWEVAAVTTWPSVVLQPGQKTEIYVATKRKSEVTRGAQRPSLLGGF